VRLFLLSIPSPEPRPKEASRIVDASCKRGRTVFVTKKKKRKKKQTYYLTEDKRRGEKWKTSATPSASATFEVWCTVHRVEILGGYRVRDRGVF
jgi:hypothetical protein